EDIGGDDLRANDFAGDVCKGQKLVGAEGEGGGRFVEENLDLAGARHSKKAQSSVDASGQIGARGFEEFCREVIVVKKPINVRTRVFGQQVELRIEKAGKEALAQGGFVRKKRVGGAGACLTNSQAAKAKRSKDRFWST